MSEHSPKAIAAYPDAHLVYDRTNSLRDSKQIKLTEIRRIASEIREGRS